jgi:hypothetical protein
MWRDWQQTDAIGTVSKSVAALQELSPALPVAEEDGT